jgi:hypothetical protein
MAQPSTAIITCMNSPYYNTNGLEEQATEAPKERFSKNSIVQIVAALLTILPWLTGWAKSSPIHKVMLTGIGVVILLWIASPTAVYGLRKLIGSYRKRRFVREEQAELNNILQSFRPFVNENDSRSLIPILRNVAQSLGPDAVVIYRIIGSNHISRWLCCFTKNMHSQTSDIDCFMARCQEFTVIVDQFNRDYVVKSQNELENGPPLPAHHIHQLEQFREEFIAYLRDVDQWANRIAKSRCDVVNGGQPLGTLLVSNFERVKTFRRSSGKTIADL